jgi:hypothetical protein
MLNDNVCVSAAVRECFCICMYTCVFVWCKVYCVLFCGGMDVLNFSACVKHNNNNNLDHLVFVQKLVYKYINII